MAVWVLGIDTSCDDTGVGLVRDGEVVVNLVAGQVTLHQASVGWYRSWPAGST